MGVNWAEIGQKEEVDNDLPASWQSNIQQEGLAAASIA